VSNEYRLGAVFLRNFLLGLDYEYNEIALGLNLGVEHARFVGSRSNPYKDTGIGGMLIVLGFMAVLVIVAIVFYVKQKNDEE